MEKQNNENWFRERNEANALANQLMRNDCKEPGQ
jgi:hypothetical protein